MIFLINQERVLVEMLELAKHKISGILEIKPTDVNASLQVTEGLLKPRFSLNLASGQSYEKAYIERVMADVWQTVKTEMVNRLAGLKAYRERRENFGASI